jgi:hypothetical protein
LHDRGGVFAHRHEPIAVTINFFFGCCRAQAAIMQTLPVALAAGTRNSF